MFYLNLADLGFGGLGNAKRGGTNPHRIRAALPSLPRAAGVLFVVPWGRGDRAPCPPQDEAGGGELAGGFEGSGGTGRALIQDLPAVAGWWL